MSDQSHARYIQEQTNLPYQKCFQLVQQYKPLAQRLSQEDDWTYRQVYQHFVASPLRAILKQESESWSNFPTDIRPEDAQVLAEIHSDFLSTGTLPISGKEVRKRAERRTKARIEWLSKKAKRILAESPNAAFCQQFLDKVAQGWDCDSIANDLHYFEIKAEAWNN